MYLNVRLAIAKHELILSTNEDSNESDDKVHAPLEPVLFACMSAHYQSIDTNMFNIMFCLYMQHEFSEQLALVGSIARTDTTRALQLLSQAINEQLALWSNLQSSNSIGNNIVLHRVRGTSSLLLKSSFSHQPTRSAAECMGIIALADIDFITCVRCGEQRRHSARTTGNTTSNKGT